MGGDEAQALNLTQYNAFVQRAQNLVAAHGRTPIAWAEAGTAPLLPQTVLEYWNTAQPQPYVLQAAAKGTKLIMAPGNHAYLDQQPVAGFRLGLHWAGFVPVSKAYDWDPVTVLPGVRRGGARRRGPAVERDGEEPRRRRDARLPPAPGDRRDRLVAAATHDWPRFVQATGRPGAAMGQAGDRLLQVAGGPWG